MTSDPAKGLRWRSPLSGTVLQLDRKSHRKVSILHPVSWPFINSSTFTYNTPSNKQSVSLWTLTCVILPEVQHKKCCRRYQPMNHGAHLMEAKERGSCAVQDLAWQTDLHSPIFAGNPSKTNAEQLSQKGGELAVSAVNWSHRCAWASAAAGP